MTWWDLTSIWSNPTVSNRLFVITQHCWIRALFCGIKLLEIDLMSKNCSVVRKFQIFSGLLTILEENRIASVFTRICNWTEIEAFAEFWLMSLFFAVLNRHTVYVSFFFQFLFETYTGGTTIWESNRNRLLLRSRYIKYKAGF